jgi:hypothetical protein
VIFQNSALFNQTKNFRFGHFRLNKIWPASICQIFVWTSHLAEKIKIFALKSQNAQFLSESITSLADARPNCEILIGKFKKFHLPTRVLTKLTSSPSQEISPDVHLALSQIFECSFG